MSDPEIQNTIDQISVLIDTLSTQCGQLKKDDNKEQLVEIKQQIRKLENKLLVILPEAKVPISTNGDKLDKLKARAQRFGCENDEVKKVTESEKIAKRKERFGKLNLDSSSPDDAKKRRLARFSGQN